MQKPIKIICLLCVLAIACSLIFSACEDNSTTEKNNEEESSIEKNDEETPNITAMSLNGIEVTQKMMTYFFRVNYMNDLSNLENTLYYYELYGIDTSALGYSYPDATKSLKDQPYYGVAGNDTWYNTILNLTKEQVTEYLMFAAAAKKADVALNDTDQAAVDSELDNVIASIKSSTGATSYTADACCELAFGKGIRAADVRDALELQALATKMYTHLSETITAAVEGDETRINELFEEKPHLFSYVDYYSFSFDVYYDDVVSEKYGIDKYAEDLTDEEKEVVLALYKEKIEKARANAEALASKATLVDFKSMIAEFTANEEYNGIYDIQVKNLRYDKLPIEEDLYHIKKTLITNVINEISNGEPEAINDVKSDSEDESIQLIYDIAVTPEFAAAIKNTKENLFSTVVAILDSANCERIYYYESKEGAADDEISVWAFDKARVDGEKTIFESGDGADGAKIDDLNSKKFSAQVITLTKSPYKDLTLTRDFAYLIFTSEEAAKTAITEVAKIENLTTDNFLALASSETNPAYGSQLIENFAIGLMENYEFDEWLFSENTKPGDYTKEIIDMGNGSYMVALCVKQNNIPEWKYNVIQYLADEDYIKSEEELTNKYTPQIVENTEATNNLNASASTY